MEEVVQDLSWRRCLPDCDWRMGTLTHCACGWSYCWVCGWSYRWAWPLGWKSESWMPYLWVIKSWMTDFTLLCTIYLNYNLIWKVLVALNSWVSSCGSSFLLIFSTRYITMMEFIGHICYTIRLKSDSLICSLNKNTSYLSRFKRSVFIPIDLSWEWQTLFDNLTNDCSPTQCTKYMDTNKYKDSYKCNIYMSEMQEVSFINKVTEIQEPSCINKVTEMQDQTWAVV